MLAVAHVSQLPRLRAVGGHCSCHHPSDSALTKTAIDSVTNHLAIRIVEIGSTGHQLGTTWYARMLALSKPAFQSARRSRLSMTGQVEARISSGDLLGRLSPVRKRRIPRLDCGIATTPSGYEPSAGPLRSDLAAYRHSPSIKLYRCANTETTP